MERFIPGDRPRKADGQLTITIKPRGKSGSQAYLSAALAQALEDELKRLGINEELRWVTVYIDNESSPLLMIGPTHASLEFSGEVPDEPDEKLMRSRGALRYNPTHRVVATEDLASRFKVPVGKKIHLVPTRIRLPGAEQEVTLWAGSLALEGAD